MKSLTLACLWPKRQQMGFEKHHSKITETVLSEKVIKGMMCSSDNFHVKGRIPTLSVAWAPLIFSEEHPGSGSAPSKWVSSTEETTLTASVGHGTEMQWFGHEESPSRVTRLLASSAEDAVWQTRGAVLRREPSRGRLGCLDLSIASWESR